MSEEIKSLKERIEKLLESGWVNEFNYLESQLQEARSLVVILQLKVEQLENIRKEAIEEIQRVLDIWTNKPNEIATLDLGYLLNILNKGDNK